MKKLEFVYREILYNAMDKGNKKMTQFGLADALGISLSTVNNALAPLKKMNAIRINKMNFQVIDIKKILFYWASVRNVEKDIVYQTRINLPVRKIESELPSSAVYTAYSGYKFMFKNVPADYSEVYVYSDDINEIKKRFPENKNNPNLFVLKDSPRKITIAQLFVDLWNLNEWYAKDFLNALEAKIKW